jgi:beta-1,4-mannooligosaccharide/beta-1,4-mannosyl-N-acetylglucosamine phosphorylase
MKIQIKAEAVPNLPWEEPGDRGGPVWRYSGNPVISRDVISAANSVFNSAVAAYDGGFAGVFRCDDTSRRMNIHRGFSADGFHWTLDEAPIDFASP